MQKVSQNIELVILEHEDSFRVQERSYGIVIQESSYSGTIPRIDLWKKCPVVWLWLLEHNIFTSRKVVAMQKKEKFLLRTDINKISSYSLQSANRFESQTDFIVSLIDKLELELLTSDDVLASADFIRLSSLENICHQKNINLYNFFLSLELDIPLVQNDVHIQIDTSASLYHKAIAIIANAKGLSYREISKKTGISRVNLLSDKSDSLKGKRKTIELRTLFIISQALEISLSAFFVLCHMIQESDIYESFMKKDC